jgi:hypothetical protein
MLDSIIDERLLTLNLPEIICSGEERGTCQYMLRQRESRQRERETDRQTVRQTVRQTESLLFNNVNNLQLL